MTDTNKSGFVKGIGTDIIEIDRMKRAIERHHKRFLERIFTEKERLYCNRYPDSMPHYAARFAAKEAVAKALGCGIGHSLKWQDIEIDHAASGKPIINFSKEVNAQFDYPNIQISLSHCKKFAVAMAIWC
ncbi:MAG: holo-ACP synthase [Parachlamydiales bacterium]|nr:holo-ACP synthase [Parachlamydiales bacterium]